MAIPPSIVLAFKCIPPVIEAAKGRRTMTYGELSKEVDHPAFYLGKPLAYVRDEICAKHRLPPLTAIVVNSEGRPGDSFLPGGREGLSDQDYDEIIASEQAKVYDYPKWDETWLRLKAHYQLD